MKWYLVKHRDFTLLHGAEFFFRRRKSLSLSESEGSLPCSQDPILVLINTVHTQESYSFLDPL